MPVGGEILLGVKHRFNVIIPGDRLIVLLKLRSKKDPPLAASLLYPSVALGFDGKSLPRRAKRDRHAARHQVSGRDQQNRADQPLP
ncbi:hypothetical protein A3K48_07210 [candidate division WOR-1 bacterium RIFOXYA12_FULL_52_29]|uniref:Uncharacterized protein n=1 Tax=candidate division WOR-1 bacterium RIFOXYC12_FULL_54_18 TaxID=1802584 RepID=A0A1F4T9I7_UNCSA|nr:MAG: hypothetical protein A3K44_07210 [candidate division WOR-1 bacterium RIFOXYA2_FULL_51_19]OGC18306.1 MAG: hypothetical protein A3K48_07210 [candidate division WOR-1 bacterium RIFOXYA12_FULL_52_29]OGC27161.1 MAG: hypothetical protein A3K32_07205 [candidate division WOR-1 bacterium RIFOXYB2_FULL_45_9]OGC28723.1 MAG: hypothetical protein A3K49_07210 [candidate division WOR-1 bacterium RIFOXYC12_FULL_54_18]OGC30822.1 MAG: hypothetical protein A2346_05410 [candidate division WOR-1 bacterium R